MNEIELDWN